jgi:hypothetical protein
MNFFGCDFFAKCLRPIEMLDTQFAALGVLMAFAPSGSFGACLHFLRGPSHVSIHLYVSYPVNSPTAKKYSYPRHYKFPLHPKKMP